jgi:predicted RNase H-like nuclease (RuvC/YqgF family)
VNVSHLKAKILSLENDKMLLEKKLKFFTIIDNMRNSTKIPVDEKEIKKIEEKLKESQQENKFLKDKIQEMENSSEFEEKLKKVRKELKKEKKMHEADLYVLSDLQKVET